MEPNKNWLKVANRGLIAGVSGSVLLTLISLGLYSFEIMTKYKLKSFPGYLFINGDDKVVARASGYFPPKDFLFIGKSIHEKIVKPS
jgi:hypothetical protein